MENYIALKASAGTGKTFALAVRYLSLMAIGANPSEIVALTFTNKAAAEMKERIAAILANPDAHAAEWAAVSSETGIPGEKIAARLPKMREVFLRERLQIGTIDSFVGSLLRSFAINLGLRPDFEIGEISDEEMLETFLRDAIREGRDGALVEFAKEEEKRIEAIHGYFRDLSEREKEVLPLLRRYVTEIEPVSKEMVDEAEEGVLATAARLRDRVHADSRASATAKRAVAFASVEEIASKSWMGRDTLNYRTFSRVWDEELDALFLDLKAALGDYMALREMRSLQSLAYLYILYKEASFRKKRSADLLSFADVTNYAYDLLYEKRVPSDLVLFRLDNRVGHLLIDEFQDTSVVQYRILRPLIEEILSGAVDSSGLPKTFFYVGDTKQSIYRFRGGNRHLFDAVAREFGIPVRHMDTNYRSASALVAYANEIFGSRYDDYVRQKARDGAPEGYVHVFENADPMDAAVRRVADLVAAGVSPGEIAVLCFTNAEVAAARAAIGRKMPGTPVVTDTSARLVNHPSVAALIALMKYVHRKEEYYRALFNTLSGRAPDTPLDVSEAEAYRDSPLRMALNLCERFHLNGEDVNVANFVEACVRFADMEEFCHRVDDLDDPIADIESLDAIRILTIHKSKGLEFENVVVVDRTAAKSTRRGAFIYEYDGIDLVAVRYRARHKEAFDMNYRAALEKERAEEYVDSLNALYVALTRPRRRLFVSLNSDFDRSEFAFANVRPREIGSFGPVERRAPAENRKKRPDYDGHYYGRQRFVDNRRRSSGPFEEAFRYALEMLSDPTSEGLLSAMAQVRTRYGLWMDARAEDAVRSLAAAAAARDSWDRYASGTRNAPVSTAGGRVEYADFLKVGDESVDALVVALSDEDYRRARRIRNALAGLYPGRRVTVEVEPLYDGSPEGDDSEGGAGYAK